MDRQLQVQVYYSFLTKGLMYYLVGSTINLLFEDEVANFSPLSKNILCGAITGGIYKSTLGMDSYLY